MDFEGWTPEEIQARMDEIRPQVDEFHFIQELLYLEAEGFIDIEQDEAGEYRLYHKENPCSISIPQP